MGGYAAETTVSPEQSRTEIERTLRRYGADGFAYAWEGTKAQVQFRADGRFVRFVIQVPGLDEFALTPTRKRRRSPAQQEKAWERACRQKWRALALVVKAKLEAVESGITTFDEEFLANVVMPNNRTVGEAAIPAIAAAYETGQMPRALLPGLEPED